jgi:hypothetical protein
VRCGIGRGAQEERVGVLTGGGEGRERPESKGDGGDVGGRLSASRVGGAPADLRRWEAAEEARLGTAKLPAASATRWCPGTAPRQADGAAPSSGGGAAL